MGEAADTFERSCAHWSEAAREEMEQFYALASVDYRHLAEALDWKAWLEARQQAVGDRPLRLLDVACGSGKFPTALLQHAAVGEAQVLPLAYSLLDPSGFSIAEAKSALAAPFVPDQEHEVTLQDLDCPEGAFDIAWATHALYAVPSGELRAGLERYLHALSRQPKGTGFIAHASDQAHYLRFYQHFLEAFRGGAGEPYVSAEQILSTLDDLGVSYEHRQIAYENGAPTAQQAVIEGYLQRCVFDDSVSLSQMLEHPQTGAYLRGCVKGDDWRFSQKVSLIFFQP